MAHGSPLPAANDDVRRVATEIRHRKVFPYVEIGYLDCNEPNIPTALDRCASAGATEVLCVPYFLHSGKHLLRDVPDILEERSNRYPEIDIRMGDYLGHDPILAEVLLDRIHEAFSGESIKGK